MSLYIRAASDIEINHSYSSLSNLFAAMAWGSTLFPARAGNFPGLSEITFVLLKVCLHLKEYPCSPFFPVVTGRVCLVYATGCCIRLPLFPVRVGVPQAIWSWPIHPRARGDVMSG